METLRVHLSEETEIPSTSSTSDVTLEPMGVSHDNASLKFVKMFLCDVDRSVDSVSNFEMLSQSDEVLLPVVVHSITTVSQPESFVR